MERKSAADIYGFIASLILLQSHIRLYGEGNRIIEQSSAKAMQFFKSLVEGKDEITLFVGQHAFIYDEQFIEQSSHIFDGFANNLFHYGISAITFSKELTVNELRSLLLLTSKKISAGVTVGNFSEALGQQGVVNIKVREMSELDFSLEAQSNDKPADSVEETVSPLWQRYALSIAYGLNLDSDLLTQTGNSPVKLAELINRLIQNISDGERQALTRDLTRTFLSLQKPKTHFYREATLKILADFVNELAPQVRSLFISNIFNLDSDMELCERFLKKASDHVIIDALQNAAVNPGYLPPVALQLLGRLSSERNLPPVEYNAEVFNQERADRITELFREDEFEKYVPLNYRKALFAVLKCKGIHPRLKESLDQLKQTIHPDSQDRHMGEILFKMMDGSLQVDDLELLSRHLKETIDHYLVTGEYKKILALLDSCVREQNWGIIAPDIFGHFSSPTFSNRLLDDLVRLDTEKFEESLGLIKKIGSPFISVLMDRLGTESNRSIRRIYLNVLLKFGNQCISHAQERLNDSRWFVVRNMIYLLRELGDRSCLPIIRQRINHANQKVSQEALKTCLFMRDAEVTPFLLGMLNSQNEEDLVRGVANAAFSDDPTVFSRLCSILQEGGVMNFHLDLKKGVIRTLVSSYLQKSLPVFKEIIASHSLLHGKQLDALKLEIISALERSQIDEAKKFLVDLSKSETTMVAKAAQASLAGKGGVMR